MRRCLPLKQSPLFRRRQHRAAGPEQRKDGRAPPLTDDPDHRWIPGNDAGQALTTESVNNSRALTQRPQMPPVRVALYNLSPSPVLTAVLIIYLFFGCVINFLAVALLTIPIISTLASGIPGRDFGPRFGLVLLIVV